MFPTMFSSLFRSSRNSAGARQAMDRAARSAAPRFACEMLEMRQLLAANIDITDSVGVATDLAMNLGAREINQASAAQYFTLTNSSAEAIDIVDITLAGANAGDFAVLPYDSDDDFINSSSFSIPAGEAYTLGIIFEPEGTGARSATVGFTASDPIGGDSGITLNVSGTGNAATIPTAPGGAWAKPISSGHIRIYWDDNSDNETGFKILRATALDGTYSVKATVPAGTTQYNHLGLAAGTHYYYRVVAFTDAGMSGYTADDATTAADAAGNSLGTARNLGKLVGRLAIRDFIGVNDSTDFYKFSFSTAATIRLDVGEMLDDADVVLYRIGTNNALSNLAVSENFGTNDEFIEKSLSAGNYLIKLYRGNSAVNTSYRLVYEADYTGDTRATARNAGTPGAAKSYNEFAGDADTDDFYKITLTSTKTVKLVLSGLKADLDLELQSSTGTVLEVSEDFGTVNETITKQLTAGTYYVRVLAYPGGGDSNYKLTVSAT